MKEVKVVVEHGEGEVLRLFLLHESLLATRLIALLSWLLAWWRSYSLTPALRYSRASTNLLPKRLRQESNLCILGGDRTRAEWARLLV